MDYEGYPRHLTNFDIDERPKYEAAIAQSGRDLIIRDNKYTAEHVLRPDVGCSLWCPTINKPPGLTGFWDLIGD